MEIATSEGENVDLFVEGPTADWALPVPQQISQQEGLRRFAFDLTGVPPDVDPRGAVLRLTAVTAEQAVEVFPPRKHWSTRSLVQPNIGPSAYRLELGFNSKKRSGIAR